MTMPVRRAAVAVCAAVLFAACAAPTQAATRWISGQYATTYGSDCTGGQATIASSVGYQGDPDNGGPKVGEVYYGGVDVAIGPVCITSRGVFTDVSVTLPPNTSLAVDAQHPVRCSASFRGGAQEAKTCPSYSVSGRVLTFARQELPNTLLWQAEFPLKSTAVLKGSTTGDALRADVDTNWSASRLSPTGWLWVFSGVGGNDGSGGPSGGAPTFVTDPKVTGNWVVGETIRCDSGSWTGSPQGARNKLEWVIIGGPFVNPVVIQPTSRQTVPGRPDEDASITLDIPNSLNQLKFTYWCRQTATNSAGSVVKETAHVQPLNAWPDIVADNPVIIGTARRDEVLTCQTANVQWAKGDAEYTWLRDGTPLVRGVGVRQYRPGLAEEGHDLTCRTVWSNPSHTATRLSAPVHVEAPPPMPQDPPPPPPTGGGAGGPSTPDPGPGAPGGGDAGAGDTGTGGGGPDVPVVPPGPVEPPVVVPDPPRTPLLRSATFARPPRLKTALARGLKLTVECTAACDARITLQQGRTTVGSARVRLTASGRRAVAVTFTRKARKTLAAKRKVTLTATVSVAGASGDRLSRPVKLVR